MRILVSYRGIPQSPGWATGDMTVKAFRELGHEAYPYAKYYQENRWVKGRPLLDSQDWDLILFMECNDGDPQYPELKVTRARKTACWLFDTSYHQDRYRGLVNYFGFDHLFLANPLTVGDYKVWGYSNVTYLPYACDRELHGRSVEYPKSRDVVLVGSVRDDRKHLAAKLGSLGINLELIGGVFREEYINILASSRIIINQNPNEGRGLLNMRHFEAQAAGAFLLEQADDFTLNRDAGLQSSGGFLPYDTVESIADIVPYYLKIDKDIMSYMQNNFFAYNTYKSRCESILATVFPHERN